MNLTKIIRHIILGKYSDNGRIAYQNSIRIYKNRLTNLLDHHGIHAETFLEIWHHDENLERLVIATYNAQEYKVTHTLDLNDPQSLDTTFQIVEEWLAAK